MVLDRGGLLINVSAMAASSAAVLHREPGPPRGTVLMNAGIAPGLTNLLAADLLARHPQADEVELVFTISVKGSTGPAGPHPEWLTATKRHRTTVVRLPEPFGRRRCLGIAEQHNGWLGAIAVGKTVSTYLCIFQRRMQRALLTVNAAGLIGRLPRSAFTTTPVPEATAEPIRHWVAVRQRGTQLAAGTLRCRGDYQSAAAATVLMAGQLTSHGDPLPAGVLVPEEILTIGELRPGLAKAGITVVEGPAAAPGPALASQSRTGSRELPARERGVVPRADSSRRRRRGSSSLAVAGDLPGHGGGGQLGQGGQQVAFRPGPAARPVRPGGSSYRAASLRGRVVQVTRRGELLQRGAVMDQRRCPHFLAAPSE